MTKTLLSAAAVLVTCAAPAAAQDPGPGGPPPILRPVELSIGVAGVSSSLASGGSIRVTVTIPRGDRKSFEIFGGPFLGTTYDDPGGGILASYGFQITRRFDRGSIPGLRLFASSGFEGIVMRKQTYSCYGPGCAPHDRTYVLPPIVWMIGAGMEKVLSPHCALRMDAHALIAFVAFGVRAGVSLSFPLGERYRTGGWARR